MDKKTALLILDIQNDYFSGGKMPLERADEAAKNSSTLLRQFRKNNLPLVIIQHVANKPDATFFIAGTRGVEINDYVKPLEDEKVIIKHHPNSFKDTELLNYLRLKEVSNLVICGMMTHMCIDATVRAAKDYGFHCTLIADACATKELEFNGVRVSSSNVQTAFLSALNVTYANILDTEDFLSRF